MYTTVVFHIYSCNWNYAYLKNEIKQKNIFIIFVRKWNELCLLFFEYVDFVTAVHSGAAVKELDCNILRLGNNSSTNFYWFNLWEGNFHFQHCGKHH